MVNWMGLSLEQKIRLCDPMLSLHSLPGPHRPMGTVKTIENVQLQMTWREADESAV